MGNLDKILGGIQEEEDFQKHLENLSKKEAIKLQPSDILRVIISENFARALNIAGKTTKKTGHETGFTVEMLENKQFRIPEVKKGMTDMIGVTRETTLAEIDGEDLKYYGKQGLGFLISLHFHPEQEGAIAPSTSDLLGISKEIGNISFLGVAQINKKGDLIKILLIKTPTHNKDEADLKEYEYKIASESTKEEVEKALQEEGFKNFLIEFKKNKKGFQISPESKNLILEKFGTTELYTSKPKPEEIKNGL